MAVAMNKEFRALRDAGCRLIQIEEPTLHFWPTRSGRTTKEVKFMVDAFNREVEGLDDVEIWIHTCWGNPNMQRVMEDTSYAASLELYLERCRGDVWTLEMKDRDQRDLELFAPIKNDLKRRSASARSATDRSRRIARKTSPARSAGRCGTSRPSA